MAHGGDRRIGGKKRVRRGKEVARKRKRWLRTARLVIVQRKVPVSIRVDRNVLEWFKVWGARYQSRMNAVLKVYFDTYGVDGRIKWRKAPDGEKTLPASIAMDGRHCPPFAARRPALQRP
jgi:uncharacterized protein (DUF4415 family)